MLGCRAYVTSAWNVLALIASGCILASMISHFALEAPEAKAVVRLAGSLGVLLPWFGIYRYFTAYGATAALVKMMGQVRRTRNRPLPPPPPP